MLHLNQLRIPKFNLQNTTELATVRFFYILSIAFFETIWAVYLKSFGLTDSQIGYISSLIVVFLLIFIFYCVNILEKLSEYTSFIVASIIMILSLLLIGVFESLIAVIFMIIILGLGGVLRRNSFDILFRDSIPEGKLNRFEGILSVIGNISWFLGPILAGFIFKLYGFTIVFFISAAFSIMSLLLFFKIPKNKNSTKIIEKKSFKELFLNFIKNQKVKLPYIMSLGISIWWAFIFLYIPLFIIEENLPKEYIGIFIGLTQLPLIFFEYFVGVKSEKYGFRGFFSIGFLGLSIISILCFFISNIYIILGLLIFASFFVSLLEPLRYPYIFSKIKKSQEEEVIPFFSSSFSVGSLIAKLGVASLLLFLATKYSYLLIGIFMLILSFIAYSGIKK